MRKPKIPNSYGKAKAGNPPNRASFLGSFMPGSKVAKDRMKFARAMARKSGKRTGLLVAVRLHEEAEQAIPAARRTG